MNTKFTKLTKIGQSLWYDNIERHLLDNGELAAMIAQGEIRGVTSNPSIFHNAIAKTTDYDSALTTMAWAGWGAETIFWQLALEDIRRACDLFRPLYEQTGGGDGYVSLEVHPALAYQSEATLAQAKDLWARVDRPNLMIKIPATPDGLPAVRAAIAAGINVNTTLIFSIERYREVMQAYLSGLEDRISNGKPIKIIASVASFFVSRMDTKIDALLPSDSKLRGKAAIANAKLAYAAFQETFRGARWDKLARAGARIQRPLWASTSTKNPAYAATMYVDNLIGADTVNTVPSQTLDAFRDHGKAAVTLTVGLDDARLVFTELKEAGVSIDRVTQELETEGVKTFADAFSAMMTTIENRRIASISSLGPLSVAVERRVAWLEAEAVASRLWTGDPSLWSTDSQGQEEIRKRLGWLTLPEKSLSLVKNLQTFAQEVQKQGIQKILLLGMGGSSLAPEVMSLVFSAFPGTKDNPYKFAILDSTDPAQVLATAREFPPSESLYIVSSKSGGTAEVNAMLDYFWKLSDQDGKRFIAITDPGTSLDVLANVRGFRAIFHGNPTVGGRYSALSVFGLVPAVLLGIDPAQMLKSAIGMMEQCKPEFSAALNPGLVLGAVMGEAAQAGRDKITVIADASLASFGSWLEQLIMESSGKQGRGMLVVEGEPSRAPMDYGKDRLFIYLRATGEHADDVTALKNTRQPVLEFEINESESLGREFYRWEVATAIACTILDVNAFDQPDVQDSKERTINKINAYSHYHKLEDGQELWKNKILSVYSTLQLSNKDTESTLVEFLSNAGEGEYIAINAYLPRNPKITVTLTKLRKKISERTGCATTLGFGPRFLHSTGQYHKGGPDTGLFLQITADPAVDVEIPGQGLTFGTLEHAQALGDYEALAARGRRILRLHLTSADEVLMLIKALAS